MKISQISIIHVFICLYTASTGGLLGLCMGFSFLSLVEIVYFATLKLWCRMYKNKHAPHDNTFHVRPFDSDTNLVYPFVHWSISTLPFFLF